MANGDLAVVMSGGGARAAYQAGFMRAMADRYPELGFDIYTGTSAGAINAVFLASTAHQEFRERAERLVDLWTQVAIKDVFKVDTYHLLKRVLGWLFQLASGGAQPAGTMRGLVNTAPLLKFLSDNLNVLSDGSVPGIDEHIMNGLVKAVAVTTVSYDTARSVTWVQGRDIKTWERAGRTSYQAKMNVLHVMASAALPLFFPAVKIGSRWYGDGGIRLTAPLAPAVHLGAQKILAISTRYLRTSREAERDASTYYPTPAQVIGALSNSIFLDLMDEDALRLRRINDLISEIPQDRRGELRPIKLLVVRPSRDLGKLANEFESNLPRTFRFLTRGFGTKQTRSNDALSMVMFQQDYLRRLVDIGSADAVSQSENLDEFFGQ